MEKFEQLIFRMTEGAGSSSLGQSNKVFCLPGDVKLSFDELMIPSNEKTHQKAAKNVTKILQPQRHLSSDSTYEQTESSEFVIKQSGSSNSSSSTSLSDTFPLNPKDTLQNVSQQKVSVVNSDSHFLQYELVSSLEQAPIDYSKNKLSLEAVLEDHLSQKQCKLEEEDPTKNSLETVKAYCNSMVEVEQIMKSFQNQFDLISDDIIMEFKKNLNLQRTQLAQNQQKFYMYSVFVIDKSRIYCELLKGVSLNLLEQLEFSVGSFTEQLLRLGNTNLFDSQSSTTLTLSRMQQFVNAQQFNNFGVSGDQNLVFLRADGKSQISAQSKSQIVPLSSSVIRNNHNFIYAFMYITEVVLDKNVNNNNSNNVPVSSTTQIYPQMLSYLQSCNQLQEKYYSLGSQRKKRYRKTKLQVEQELKFYLAKNLQNLN